MENPKKRKITGLPSCPDEILYILSCAGGKETRGNIRKQLVEMGYKNHCILSAYKSLEIKNKIRYIGSYHSPNQIVLMNIDE